MASRPFVAPKALALPRPYRNNNFRTRCDHGSFSSPRA
jgi:hypothetical protein